MLRISYDNFIFFPIPKTEEQVVFSLMISDWKILNTGDVLHPSIAVHSKRSAPLGTLLLQAQAR
ncbi:hypothetical protein KSF_000510 [Reticulibacter mediterranei]|uniref:Uncharacterized protein n=1 Tax=Reticulibacter mediterranei TaxID=2778369 RepID=A0A8J3IAH2_9CHLR|nr:hypothetical protein KSF_000510 [Reticulibacter mediterranei]